jgi:hypothetical protein
VGSSEVATAAGEIAKIELAAVDAQQSPRPLAVKHTGQEEPFINGLSFYARDPRSRQMIESNVDEESSDEEAVVEPVLPSLTERLLGVTTVDDGYSSLQSTTARGLIDRLAAADKRSLSRTPATVPPPATQIRPSNSAASSRKRSHPSSGTAAHRKESKVSSPTLENALAEAHDYTRLRYFAFFSAVVFVFSLAVAFGGALIWALATSVGWQTLAIIAASEALALVALGAFLLFLQLGPPGNLRPSAEELAKREAARAYLNKSYDLWERFLSNHNESRAVTAEDVALAVSSLTAASQAVLDMTSPAPPPSKSKEVAKEPVVVQPPPPIQPTVTARPRRY